MNHNSENHNVLDDIVTQSDGKINRKHLNEAVKNKDFSRLLSSLSQEDRAKISAAMSDKAQLRALLQTDEAKSFLKNFLGGEKHG